MSRVLALVVGFGVTMSYACTDGREPAEVPQPTPERSEPPVDETPTVVAIEALALTCDGVAVQAAFAGRDLAALASDHAQGPSARLLATWEHARSFTADGTIAPEAIEALRKASTAELGREPPRWWIEQLASARRYEDSDGGPPYYDVGLTPTGDRRGELVAGPGTTKLRPNVAGAVTESDGKLFVDLGMGRLELGPIPGTEPDATLELARAQAGTTIYFASFSRGSGGFRFPLRAVDFHRGLRWEAEVCGPDRQVLGGQGYLTVEVVVLEPVVDAQPGEKRASSGATGIAVFTAETHGVALDVFDPKDGSRILAWSSDFWFTR